MSLPDEEKYHHFLYLFQRSQDLDYEVHDAREGLHQLQVELSQHRDILEEKRKLTQIIAELNEQVAFFEAEKGGWASREKEELAAVKKELLDLQQALLVQQQEKQQLLIEKGLYENELKEREIKKIILPFLKERRKRIDSFGWNCRRSKRSFCKGSKRQKS